MLIKQQQLSQYLQKKSASMYWLLGQDNYLIEASAKRIRTHLAQQGDIEEQSLVIQSTDDWKHLVEAANHYSLFSELNVLHAVYEKKTLDAAGKKIITDYLKSLNPKSIVIIKAPHMPAKQLSWLNNHEQVTLVLNYPLTAEAMQQWIIEQFKINQLHYEHDVPQLIYQHTQGNMLACAQSIEKISLAHGTNSHITKQQALEHLLNQCEHSLFDLVEACLQGQADKSIQILRQVMEQKTEATLVLWLLTQEIRTLLQLIDLTQKKTDFNSACAQLKIWTQRMPWYRISLSRLNEPVLRILLHQALLIDGCIKSNASSQVWNQLEQLILYFCNNPIHQRSSFSR